MSKSAWLIVAFILAVPLGQLAYFYATLPPRLELLGPTTPESPIGRAFFQGGAAYRARDYQKAVTVYTDYLAHESNTNRYATTILGERARALTNAKYTSARDTAFANLGRGYAELQLGLFRQAVDDFDVVLKAVPRASNALAYQGSAYEGMGDIERAIAAYKSALAIDPQQARALEKLQSLQPAQ
jgi:tetratricopeptide (TPR) repeat protein